MQHIQQFSHLLISPANKNVNSLRAMSCYIVTTGWDISLMNSDRICWYTSKQLLFYIIKNCFNLLSVMQNKNKKYYCVIESELNCYWDELHCESCSLYFSTLSMKVPTLQTLYIRKKRYSLVSGKVKKCRFLVFYIRIKHRLRRT